MNYLIRLCIQPVYCDEAINYYEANYHNMYVLTTAEIFMSNFK